MIKKKFFRLLRKTIAGNFDFKEHIGELRNMCKQSYNDFLQKDIDPQNRKVQGLEKVFLNFFPITHQKSKMFIEYINYTISDPRLTEIDCTIRGVNYGGSLRVNLKVTNLQTNEVQNVESCIGELPLLTHRGTFIINGHEKVFVGQMQKCPGVIFSTEGDNTMTKKIAIAKIYPNIGSWLHLRCDKQMSVSVDKKKKFGIVTFLLCFSKKPHEEGYTPGYDIKEILDEFYQSLELTYSEGFWLMDFQRDKYTGMRLDFDIYINGSLIVKKGESITDETYAMVNVSQIQVPYEQISNFFLAEDIFDEKTGQIFCEISEKVSGDKIEFLRKRGSIKVYKINNEYPAYVLNSVEEDGVTTKDEALKVWVNSIKLGSHYGVISLCWIFNTRFTDIKYYNLDPVGRKRLNSILQSETDRHYLTVQDIIVCCKELILLAEEKRQEDDIDSLENKRFIGVGPIMESYFRYGLIKFEKNLRDRIYNLENNSFKAADIFNMRTCLHAVLDGFYKSAQMFDNNNALSGKSHVNKISSVSQGIGKERIASGLRDTNPSKFGRMCAVQTPEGKKTGIVEQLALYTRIDDDGFITTPYHKVVNGIATKEVFHLNAFDEKNKIISSKNLYKEVEIDGVMCFEPKEGEYLLGRDGSSTGFFYYKQIDLINIADNQIFGMSASLVPFPGNNDSYRMLSASNMNTQAVPLMQLESPFIGTGMEDLLGDRIVASKAGVVKYVNCHRIVIEDLYENELGVKNIQLYSLIFNQKTNTETCINYKALVEIGDIVKEGDLIADGFSTFNGEIALGRNILVCYMSHPHCYEDAFVLSEKLVHRDLLTSINIQSHSCIVYETRNGPEKNTKDIPRAHNELLKNLDEFGVINIGVQVKSGDLLVGKVTPSSGEANLSAEYKLLNIIFGEKASEYSDSSLRLPHGCDGFVKNVRIITRKGVEKDGRTILQDKLEVDSINVEYNEKISLYKQAFLNSWNRNFKGITLKESFFFQRKGDEIVLDESILEKLLATPMKLPLSKGENLQEKFSYSLASLKTTIDGLLLEKQRKITVLRYGYDLPDGVLKIITIEIATKKIIESGDKLCGRYGNKGVISEIYQNADMPHLEDGTPVDMIINPCGLLSRMNFGQVLETTIGYGILEMQKRLKKIIIDHENGENLKKKTESINRLKECLGHIVEMNSLLEVGFSHNDVNKLLDEEVLDLSEYFYKNGIRIRSAHFAEFTTDDMTKFLENLGADSTGKVDIYDGKTGEKFFGKVLVGYEFIMKLCHLVSKKMHARSIGPYSLINQQPLGGKVRFGGQRCGEMEVWALEAHGASFNCHELLTAKSDDQKARNRLFSNLTKVQRYSLVITGSAVNKIVGESFKLLMYELRAAGFNLFILDSENNKIDTEFTATKGMVTP